MLKVGVARCINALSRVGLPVPQRILNSVRRLVEFNANEHHLRNLFAGRELLWNARGYWSVEPMPSESELNTYYSKSYWVARGDQPSLLRGRDLSHFLDIEPQLPIIQKRGESAGSALNFGAGHGGISYLLRAKGYRVLNIDPSPMSSPFFESASAVPVCQNEFDVVYASHSLEHVTDPIGTVEQLLSCLRKEGIFYVEVPNPMVDRKPPQLPELHPPHTIYFTPAFFEALPLRTIRLGTFDYRGDVDGVWRDDEHGEVIRFIGAR